ncbi:hypothetical protein PAXRUDRAFT_822749 [Paxillus rubicundulus Ve08.2h10]|uniref:Uncharacterized protein n=1 Tax=Paxillus rubicundulus Ve08.2h10 TaxID=930991 RepID=A0A0D0DLJ0_9AGAM|nr:hypothetical protein PAXRUDRAFT_822749 [Paxillus rubicundulus Ve08.2h10]
MIKKHTSTIIRDYVIQCKDRGGHDFRGAAEKSDGLQIYASSLPASPVSFIPGTLQRPRTVHARSNQCPGDVPGDRTLGTIWAP